MAALKRTVRAEQGLIDIWLHIAQDDPSAADAVLDDLDHRSHLLAANPELGPARDDIADGLRYFPSDNYLILYRRIQHGIQVVRYIHGARNLFSVTLG